MDPAILKAFVDYGLTGTLIGVIVALHWYTVRVLLPALVEKFEKALEKQWANSMALLQAERDDCRADRAKDREDHQRNFDGINVRLDRIEAKQGPR
jgi:hypothetical protein